VHNVSERPRKSEVLVGEGVQEAERLGCREVLSWRWKLWIETILRIARARESELILFATF